jgi:bacteriocin-like protein
MKLNVTKVNPSSRLELTDKELAQVTGGGKGVVVVDSGPRVFASWGFFGPGLFLWWRRPALVIY